MKMKDTFIVTIGGRLKETGAVLEHNSNEKKPFSSKLFFHFLGI